ncbi:MAG: hypothetical protein FWF96_02880, partial [Kiritimatiellaeota bacterium]|nr:hypothetical protein [Kiritimatiellota bacterium]
MSNSDDHDLSNLQFTPNWARQSPDAHHERMVRNDRKYDDWDDKRGPRRDGPRDAPRRPPRRDSDDHRPPRDRESFRRDDRPPRRDDRPPRDHEPFRRDDRPPREPRPDNRPDIRPPREHAPRDAHPPREHAPRHRDAADAPPRPAYDPLPVEIRFLPDPRTLGSIMRKVQTTHFAYPLRDMARLFLENLSACLVRVGPLKDQEATFWTCRKCGVPALTEEEIRGHFFARHFNDYFEAVQTEAEPPSGNFNCVAKCGVTGVLLGPPNHHSYTAKVQEILRGRCAGMNPETYRSRIVMLREPEAIEQWRKESSMRTLYRLKPEETPEAAHVETHPAETPAETQPSAISHQPSPETPAE